MPDTALALDSLALQVMADGIVNANITTPVGRPSGLTNADTVKKFLAFLAAGHKQNHAATLAGISKQTLFNWRKQAENGHEAAQAFFDAAERVELLPADKALTNMLKAGETPAYWKANSEFLALRYPEWRILKDEGPQVRVEVGIRITDPNIQLRPIDTTATLSPVPRNELACGEQG